MVQLGQVEEGEHLPLVTNSEVCEVCICSLGV